MANYLVLDDSISVVSAWLKATKSLSAVSKPVYNLVYSITSPSDKLPQDDAIIASFNRFAIDHKFHATETVANTIFPLDTYNSKYKTSNPDEFYEYYLNTVLPKVRKNWGTYFERMTVRRNDNGTPMMKGNRRINPLDTLINKLKRRVDDPPKTTTHYEVSIDDVALEIATYNPSFDSNYQIGGPCLSHISFKIDRNNVLRLSAFYRSHWYIERALGNLIGLARLQWFVANASGATVGPLTVVAAEAVLDLTGKGRKTAETRTLLGDFWITGGIA
jgi:hypothetical protein